MVGEVALVEDETAEESESVLDWRGRRRKGIERRRKVGKTVGVGWGLDGLRRMDILIFLQSGTVVKWSELLLFCLRCRCEEY